MNINFWKKDSLYKIFNTLEKIPTWRQVKIRINSQNEIFDNIRWGKQIKELLESKKIDYNFLCRETKVQNYYKKLWVNFTNIWQPFYKKFISFFSNTFFYWKDFHEKIIRQRSNAMYFVIWAEVLLLVFILYLFYWYITPSANIHIKPAYNIDDVTYNFRYYPASSDEPPQIKQIWIPYNIKTYEYSFSKEFNVWDLTYNQQPATGMIRVYNTTDTEYSLVSNTRFVDENWLIFRTKNWANLPSWTQEDPGVAEVEVEADVEDEDWNIIWERWNIDSWTRLLIRNLPQSYDNEEIFAESIQDFTGWHTEEDWEVTEEDIENVENNISDYINNNKRTIVWSLMEDYEEKYTFPFSQLINTSDIDIQLSHDVWESASTIQWQASFIIRFPYVEWSDLKNWVEEYISDRMSENLQLVEIDKNSPIFYDVVGEDGVYNIPTRVDVIWWYNFDLDINRIKNEIKWNILWETVSSARNEIVSYDEIDVALIRTTPHWYDTIPSIRSRININVSD